MAKLCQFGYPLLLVRTNPIKLTGPWTEGFALDLHTVSSDFIGHDEFGHPQFDTKYSEVGELLYRLKYGQDKTVMDAISETCAEFLRRKEWSIDIIVPVPPSNQYRTVQPVKLISEALGHTFGVPVLPDALVKLKSTPELKDVHDYLTRATHLKDAFDAVASHIEGRKILLVDDLYRSGATVASVTKTLIESGHAKEVRLLTVTKTRSNR